MHKNRHSFSRFAAIVVSLVLTIAVDREAFAQAADAAVLSADTEIATAGYFQLRWDAGEPIRLLEATTAEFADARVVYEGSDSGHAVSGRADGELFYRLESAASGAVLGPPVRIVVAHHPLGRALTFFGIGATVFAATAALVLLGGRISGTRSHDSDARGDR